MPGKGPVMAVIGIGVKKLDNNRYFFLGEKILVYLAAAGQVCIKCGRCACLDIFQVK